MNFDLTQAHHRKTLMTYYMLSFAMSQMTC